MEIILASCSPRRKELLSLITGNFTVKAAKTDESADASLPPRERIEKISAKKAMAIEADDAAVVISADTAVFLGDKQFGKPVDETDCREMLKALSGKTHSVISAYTVRYGKKTVTKSVETRVTFRELLDSEIEDYIKSGEPFDKAGGYGIQGGGARFSERIDGDYYCVVGLPVCSLTQTLREMGIDL